MIKFLRILMLFISTIFIVDICCAQKLLIQGIVTEAKTGNPIPFASIMFEDTSIGALSNSDGVFRLEVQENPEVSLIISAVGFIREVIPNEQLFSAVLNIKMEEDVIFINEILVTPGENPAHKILKNIINKKQQNDPANFGEWQSLVYNKMEIDLNNIRKPDKQRKLWDQAGFIFDYLDTLDNNGKTFLPVFITETQSEFYHKKDGTHERIIANKISGMKTDMITEFTGNLYSDINPYDNFIVIYNVGLVSPINDQGLIYYRYYIQDSTIVDGRKIYELSFFPKRKQDPVFRGKFWVDSLNWALTRVEMRLSENANINFVADAVYERSYQLYDDIYVPWKESLWIDFNIQRKDKGNLVGMIGRRSMVYSNFRFGGTPELIAKQKRPVVVSANALDYGEQYWDSIRPVRLQEREANIYIMVDSLTNIPMVKNIYEHIEMLIFGYKDIGKLELGPYFYFYSHNEIEGNRFRIGARTTMKFNKKLRLNGYVAYGFKDRDWKYSGGFEYFFNKEQPFILSAQYKRDYELLGRSDNSFMEDNILFSILAREKVTKLNMVDRLNFEVTREWTPGLTNTLRFSTTKIGSSPLDTKFIDQEGHIVSSIRNTEIGLNTRFAFKEKSILGNYVKTAISSSLPIADLKLTTGIKGFFGGDYDYFRFQFDLYDRLPIHPIGFSTYLLQLGRLWGDVPFPILKIHEGNETHAFNTHAFNLMNYQEFVSDRYAAISFEHHFHGLFFNKIPLFRKLQLREVVGAKCLWGDINIEKHNQFKFPHTMQSLGGKTYTEVSAGIENILKIIRIDGVWRFKESDHDYEKFLIFVSLHFAF